MKLLTVEEKEMLLNQKRKNDNNTQDDTIGTTLGDIEKELFYPAASDDLTQYNILKFYQFDSKTVAALLQTDSKLEFPFSVTELEHQIINLQSHPPKSLLLLGRSGTGKTTCLVYRMWAEFRSYWINAQQLDETGGILYGVPDQTAFSANSKEKCESKEDMQHLHTLFLTRNPVLVDEVTKCFSNIRESAGDVPQVPLDNEGLPIDVLSYDRLQDVPDLAYPLFLNAKGT
jgi:hypothetical protein